MYPTNTIAVTKSKQGNSNAGFKKYIEEYDLKREAKYEES